MLQGGTENLSVSDHGAAAIEEDPVPQPPLSRVRTGKRIAFGVAVLTAVIILWLIKRKDVK